MIDPNEKEADEQQPNAPEVTFPDPPWTEPTVPDWDFDSADLDSPQG